MAQQYTKKMIREVFIKMLNERPLNKITVKDIATACEINRNTFYYYYTDIYALLSEIFQIELQTVIDEYNDTLSWEESFIVAARFALENKIAIYHVYNSMQREEVVNYIYNVSGNVMIRYVEKVSDGISASLGDRKLIASFYQCALTEMVLHWIATGMKEDPDIIVRRIGYLFDGNIELSLKRSAGLTDV
ncbi:TetR/AcrR family transcriptional regulator C-terminal domain-containing protein [Clostridium botulinum]|uniref:TetR/AcrR family transcriptional regulator n=1 Tax=Clostridium TaxID=1485 RepID=UPI00062BFD06|nr:TetR/AcrR family transcriptional regulator [Clostridium sporogenes]EJE7235588.1 TetR/AcrR family transcriptional regulator C-terminal domain-containing protein [Clostridium botulinum]EJE7236987.1 TetR/AcrR family transcriptional regulator C-terminal domain-containing protein [Clostridium botulinum]EKO1911942.1 TetR/AcrR family transcriptional regulator C-terminal domain-containing protein [Clostridium botulinum]EKO2042003.1 TetR/AcrR family transcriptional regulator C-terminal domain-contain